MQIFYFKSSLALLIHSLFIIALFTPDLSFAYYRAGHHGSYGHYGYSKYGGYRYYPNKYYQRNHYRYSPYRSYQNYPRPYSTVVPTNTKVYSDSNVYQQSKANYSGVDSSGWQILAQGQYSAALNVFAVESQSHPDSGIPKAGYALATAASGNLAGAPCYLTKFRDSCRLNSFTYAANGRCPERPASVTTTHKSRFVITPSNGWTAIRNAILASLARYRALRLSELPCRLSGTKNHHFASAPFP